MENLQKSKGDFRKNNFLDINIEMLKIVIKREVYSIPKTPEFSFFNNDNVRGKHLYYLFLMMFHQVQKK